MTLNLYHISWELRHFSNFRKSLTLVYPSNNHSFVQIFWSPLFFCLNQIFRESLNTYKVFVEFGSNLIFPVTNIEFKKRIIAASRILDSQEQEPYPSFSFLSPQGLEQIWHFVGPQCICWMNEWIHQNNHFTAFLYTSVSFKRLR